MSGQVVDAEIEEIHRTEGAEQRERNRDARDKSREDVTQEEKDDRNDDPDGEQAG
jgi:hypothetical protein